MSSRHNKKQKDFDQIAGYNQMSGGQYNQRLAEATVPYQVYSRIWEPMSGLMVGTIFPELYRPYQGKS